MSSLNGFAGDVALSLSGLPAEVGTAAFTPAVVGGAGSSQLTVTTSAGAPAGTYTLTVTGTSGSLVRSMPVTLVVTSAADFALSVSPSSRTVRRGGSTSYTVSVSSLGGFAGAVRLSVSGLPSGATATFTPRCVAAPGTSRMAIRAGGRTVRGTFTLTVTGQSGSKIHQATTTLIVK